MTGTYTAFHRYDSVASADALTIQLAAGAARSVVLTRATVYASALCAISVERDGSAATGTAVAPAALNPEYPAATARAYFFSDAGVGTVLARHVISAGDTMVLDLSEKTLMAGQNFTIRTQSSWTGTSIINLQWEEY